MRRAARTRLVAACAAVVLGLWGWISAGQTAPAPESVPASPLAAPPKLDPEALEAARTLGEAAVLVNLAEQADLTPAFAMTSKEARGRFVVARLREVANRTQGDLVKWLATRGAPVERFWVSNTVVTSADVSTLVELAGRPDVARVKLKGTQKLIAPVDYAKGVELAAPDLLERGLREIGVDDVWRMGYRGEGVVIAVSDTGAAWEHPALKASYRGLEGEQHDYNWFDAVNQVEAPLDANGHGTHVVGTVVGKAGTREIGAAPDAKWIACRLIEQRSGGDEQIMRCLQWFLAPTKVDGRTDPRPELAPDVINASWGESPGQSCLSTTLNGAIGSLNAGGILFVASGGNSGSDCGTVCTPGAYRDVLTVANYDVQSRRINDSSSRGPVDWPDGSIIKPDIAAPGTDINSSVPPASYDKKTGTSMAAPHITGVVALMMSAQPRLQGDPAAVKAMMLDTGKELLADRCGPGGSRGYNNAAGHGLVQAQDAVELALSATPPPTATDTPTPTDTPVPSATPTDAPTSAIQPGRTLWLPWAQTP
jgi:subtilisin family serine protease